MKHIHEPHHEKEQIYSQVSELKAKNMQSADIQKP